MMPIHAFLGSWRIVETELWEQGDLDEIVEAHLTLEKDHLGVFAFLCVRADVDYRVVERDGLPAIEFSFLGEDEMDPVSGRGWAALAADELRGRLFFHRGDDSDFLARREKRQARGRRQEDAQMRFQDFPESDWKVFRELREVALDRFCRRVLDEIEPLRLNASRSHHERYLDVFRLLQERDQELANAFNDPRRSQMISQLAAIHAYGLLEPDELARFTRRTRATVELFAKEFDR